MSDRTFKLISSLSPEECVARLSAAINIPPDGYDRLWNGSGNAAVRGKIQTDSFSLSVQVPGNNFSLSTSLLGAIRSETEGTIIHGRCILDPELRKIMWGAAFCAIFIGIPIIVLLASDLRSGAVRSLSDLFGHESEISGLVAITGFNAIYPMACHNSKYYGDVLINFLVQTLEVHSVSRVR